MNTEKLSEGMLAHIPDDATGLLIMKITGTLTAVDNAYVTKEMEKALQKAGIRSPIVVISGNSEPFEFTMQHLTDDALRDIGFQRIYSEFT